MGIISVHKVARATSFYTLRRDHETSWMQAWMDAQQVRLDYFEDLLDVMAVGNPLLQRALEQKERLTGWESLPWNPRIEIILKRASPTTTLTV